MYDFLFFLQEGWHHIISLDALDHLLFIIALGVIYRLSAWKQVLWLVTAFTLGHGITLVLSVLDILRFRDDWVEFLIPCTIAITAGANFFQRQLQQPDYRVNYAMAFSFGLIHGMGYANAIRFMLARGQNLATGLLGFNIGLEIGQIFVVLSILLLSHLARYIPGHSQQRWVYAVSLSVLLPAVWMALQRVPATI